MPGVLPNDVYTVQRSQLVPKSGEIDIARKGQEDAHAKDNQ